MQFSKDGIDYPYSKSPDRSSADSIERAIKHLELKRGDILYIKEGCKVMEMVVGKVK
jgi:hypothetical protein